MRTIQILGTGCQKCRLLAEYAEKAAQGLGIEYRLEKVTDLKAIAAFGVMATPALAVDGTVKFAGRVPSLETLKDLLA